MVSCQPLLESGEERVEPAEIACTVFTINGGVKEKDCFVVKPLYGKLGNFVFCKWMAYFHYLDSQHYTPVELNEMEQLG